MSLITDTQALAALCERLAESKFVTVDTEFIREKTYWPRLCLIQVAGEDEAACIDPLADGIELAPFFELMRDASVLKVFHAARQDLEILMKLMGELPKPIFDTQVAAMVCGFGESVGYETLATRLANAHIDKSTRFTDWSKRPLTERQVIYALGDVIPLRKVYRKLAAVLARSGRADWLAEEMLVLTTPATYVPDPREMFRRLKSRTKNPRFLAVLRELAAWREMEAQRRDLPRQRVLRDEALLELAASAPTTPAALAETRQLPKSMTDGPVAEAIAEAVEAGLSLPMGECPDLPAHKDHPPGLAPVVDLLRVLLKTKCDAHGVAPKIVATTEELEDLASSDDAPVRALSGWRRVLFGEDALRLKHGHIAFAISPESGRIELIPVEDAPEEDEDFTEDGVVVAPMSSAAGAA
ncbi:ribonuclease D [Oleispirillum naphthae]|uniref:ribonuclease D n=1 Tax=Oleispirillum naphthae TaxID=2838853 RepID=UPI0030824B89